MLDKDLGETRLQVNAVFRSTYMREIVGRMHRFSQEGEKDRFLLPLVLVIGLKLLVASAVYALATHGGTAFSTFWVHEWGIRDSPGLALLFHGWDSAWYMRVAREGYSYPAYAFLPAYPFLIRMVNLLVEDWVTSSFAVSFFLGVVAVPMFQLLMEDHMSRRRAMVVTLLFATFPPVFFFTSIAYTESLFTVAILGTWLFCLRKHWMLSSIFSVIATLTKVYGFIVCLPLAIRLLDEKRRKEAFLTVLIPSAAFLGWNYYLFTLSGDLMAFWSSQRNWQEGWPFGINSLVRSAAISVVNASHGSALIQERLLVIAVWIVVVSLVGIPVVASVYVDREFGLYGVLLFLFLASFGNVWSFGRLLPFVLPAWLTVRTSRRFAMVLPILIFAVVSGVVWYQFVILGSWMG
jgi:hypothetical protein